MKAVATTLENIFPPTEGNTYCTKTVTRNQLAPVKAIDLSAPVEIQRKNISSLM